MSVIQTPVNIQHSGHIPIITVGQPLYTIAKQIHWRWAETHGEDHLVIHFGGCCHIEMVAKKILRDLLNGTGWTGVLVLAEVAPTGTVDSFLKVAHVTPNSPSSPGHSQ